MTNVQEIQAAIESLPSEEYARLREWFMERDWELWDKEIEEDSKTGKLDFLVEQARNEKKKGHLKDL